MPFLPYWSDSEEVPDEGAEFLSDHPLIAHYATHVFHGRHTYNRITGLEPTWNGAGRTCLAWDNYGVSPHWNTGTRYHSSPAGAADTSTPWTQLIIGHITNTVNNRALVIQTDVLGVGPGDRDIRFNAGAGLRCTIDPDAAATITVTLNIVSSTRPFLAVVACDTSTLRMYTRSPAFSSASISSGGVTGGTRASTSVLAVGRGMVGDATGTMLGGIPLYVRLYGVAWTLAEAHAWLMNPWQVFKRSPGRVFFFPTSSVSYKAAWGNSSNTMIQTPTT